VSISRHRENLSESCSMKEKSALQKQESQEETTSPPQHLARASDSCMERLLLYRGRKSFVYDDYLNKARE